MRALRLPLLALLVLSAAPALAQAGHGWGHRRCADPYACEGGCGGCVHGAGACVHQAWNQWVSGRRIVPLYGTKHRPLPVLTGPAGPYDTPGPLFKFELAGAPARTAPVMVGAPEDQVPLPPTP
jgi:hypothetical protein